MNVWIRRTVVIVAALGLLLASCRGAGAPQALEAALVDGRWGAADAAAAEWLQRVGYRGDAAVVRGYAALARGDGTAAAAHFLSGRGARTRAGEGTWVAPLSTRHPTGTLVRTLAGDAAARRGELAAALADLDVAVRGDDAGVARLARAVVHQLRGESTAALADLDALVAAGSVGADALVSRALVRLERAEVDDAEADVERALAVAPAHPVALNTRGVVRARRGDWAAAADDFERAFGLLPALEEARANWRLVRAAGARGAALSARSQIGSVTIVSAAPDRMNMATATMSDALRAKVGVPPLIVTNPVEAGRLGAERHVLLQLPNHGLGAMGGDRMLGALRDVRANLNDVRVPVNVVSHGYEASDSSLLGVLRYQHTTPLGARPPLSVQIHDPSELAGLVGRTPLGNAPMADLARRANDIDRQGAPVSVFAVDGKLGTQHMDLKRFNAFPGLDVYRTPTRSTIDPSLSIPFGVGIGATNARDQVMSRTDLAPRDFFRNMGGAREHLNVAVPDLAARHLLGGGAALPPPALDRGGILLGMVRLARGSGGRVMLGDGAGDGELVVISTIFGRPVERRIATHDVAGRE
jgi:tetratricopeptide (TPR) repeat protein